MRSSMVADATKLQPGRLFHEHELPVCHSSIAIMLQPLQRSHSLKTMQLASMRLCVTYYVHNVYCVNKACKVAHSMMHMSGTCTYSICTVHTLWLPQQKTQSIQLQCSQRHQKSFAESDDLIAIILSRTLHTIPIHSDQSMLTVNSCVQDSMRVQSSTVTTGVLKTAKRKVSYILCVVLL
jgi:hypothetical protein